MIFDAQKPVLRSSNGLRCRILLTSMCMTQGSMHQEGVSGSDEATAVNNYWHTSKGANKSVLDPCNLQGLHLLRM